MILNEKVKVKINNRNCSRFKELGYDISKNEIDCKIEHLSIGSHVKITAKCELCSKEVELEYNKYLKNFNNYGFYSCKSCASKKRKQTKLERYGDENYINFEKIKQTKLERYGDEHYTNLEKTKKTTLERYGFESVFYDSEKMKEANKKAFGVDYPMLNPEQLLKIREKLSDLDYQEITTKIKQSKLERYGNENYNNLDKMKKTKLDKYGDEFYTNTKKIIDINQEKYNVNFPFENREIRTKAIESKIKKIMDKYNIISIDSVNNTYTLKCDKGHEYNISIKTFYSRLTYNIETCTICNPINSNDSYKERKIREFVESIYNGKIEIGERNQIKPYELDIYLPDLKLAIEFNGIFWHSELFKNKYYHQTKLKMCIEKGIRLITVWEDVWDENPNKVLDDIKNIIINNFSLVIEKNKIYNPNFIDIRNIESYELLEPNLYYIKNNKRLKEKNENNIKLWDSGFIKIIY